MGEDYLKTLNKEQQQTKLWTYAREDALLIRSVLNIEDYYGLHGVIKNVS